MFSIKFTLIFCIFILVIYFVFILNGYIEYKFMIKIVMPRPERVYGMCNRRVAYGHQGLP